MLTYTFPILNAAAGTGYTFWLYGVICAAGFVFIFRTLPETKGKTLEQIERDWGLDYDTARRLNCSGNT